MRYIPLKREPKKNSLSLIIELGCGPNFVANRLESFETMIKEQGTAFWFRFWLLFCLHSGCEDLKRVQEKWPQTSNCAKIGIHHQFLQGSIDDAVKYCLRIVLTHLKPTPESASRTDAKKHKQCFGDLLQELSEMAFSANLCIMFYKWLLAKEMDQSSNAYWTTPKDYLDPNFRPGILEEFLVEKWGNKFVTLLNVKLSQVPWLTRLLYGTHVVDDDVSDKSAYPRFIKRVEDMVKANKLLWKQEIEKADEHIGLGNLEDAKKVTKVLNYTKSGTKVKSVKCDNYSEGSCDNHMQAMKHKTNHDSKRKLQTSRRLDKSSDLISSGGIICAYCKASDMFKNFRKCQQCDAENVDNPRFYCSSTCQSEKKGHPTVKYFNKHA